MTTGVEKAFGKKAGFLSGRKGILIILQLQDHGFISPGSQAGKAHLRKTGIAAAQVGISCLPPSIS